MRKRCIHLLAVLASVTAFLMHAGSAYACSAGPDFDAVQDSAIIVGGRITEWQPLGSSASDSFTPILLTMKVDRAFKGNVSGQVKFEDRGSLHGNPATEMTWAGASGSCGAFDADPKGAYVILGLSKDERGNYQSNRLQTFFIGAEPSGAAYNRALERLAPSDASTPSESSSPSRSSTPSTPQALPDTGVSQFVMSNALLEGSIVLLIVGSVLVTIARRKASA